MGKRLIISIIVLTFYIGIAACSKEFADGIKVAGFDTEFELPVNDQIVLSKGSEKILLTLTSLRDSRCPKDVQCVWAGNALAEIKLNAEDGSESTASLCIGQCDKSLRTADTVVLSLNRTSYTVILSDVKTEGTSRALLKLSRN